MTLLYVWNCVTVLAMAYAIELPELDKISSTCASVKDASGVNYLQYVKVNKEKCLSRSTASTGHGSVENIFLNISLDRHSSQLISVLWTFTGRKIPGRFFLYLDFFDDENYSQVNTTCVMFQLTENKQMAKVPLAFKLDCLPLFGRPNLYLAAQVVTRKSSSANCPDGRRRRSLFPASCIECTDKVYVPASEAYYSAELCTCSMTPKLDWSYNISSKKFKVTFTNLPKYLQRMEIAIAAYESGLIVEGFPMCGDEVHNSSVTVFSSRQYHNGTYFINLHAECPESEGLLLACHSNILNIDFLHQKYSIPKLTTPPHEGPTPVVTIVAVVSSVVVTALVTVIVLVCWRRKSASSRSKEGMQYSPNNEALIARESGIEMQEKADVTKGLLQQDPIKNETHFIEEPPSTSKEGSENTQDRVPENGLGDRPRQQEPGSLGIPSGRPDDAGQIMQQIYNTGRSSVETDKTEGFDISEIVEDYKQDRGPYPSSWTSGYVLKNNSKVLLLSHPEKNETFCKKVNEIIFAIQYVSVADKSEELDSNITKNWKGFAETVLDTYNVLIILLSPGMNQLCNCPEGVIDENLLLERCYEYIPVILLQKLQTMLQQNPRIPEYSVYLIALDCNAEEGDQLVDDFLKSHDCISHRDNVSSFVIHGTSIFSPDARPTVQAFFKKLTQSR